MQHEMFEAKAFCVYTGLTIEFQGKVKPFLDARVDKCTSHIAQAGRRVQLEPTAAWAWALTKNNTLYSELGQYQEI